MGPCLSSQEGSRVCLEGHCGGWKVFTPFMDGVRVPAIQCSFLNIQTLLNQQHSHDGQTRRTGFIHGWHGFQNKFYFDTDGLSSSSDSTLQKLGEASCLKQANEPWAMALPCIPVCLHLFQTSNEIWIQNHIANSKSRIQVETLPSLK